VEKPAPLFVEFVAAAKILMKLRSAYKKSAVAKRDDIGGSRKEAKRAKKL
jgi:hypothetical protein